MSSTLVSERVKETMIGPERLCALRPLVATAQSVSIVGSGMELWSLVALAVTVGKETTTREEAKRR